MKSPTRTALLAFLKQNEWVSGETISAELNISRAAIWKNIKSLRELGYIIESSTGVGYKLSETPNLLIPEEILFYLDTQLLGQKKIYYYKSVDSTNTTAGQKASDGAEEGTIIIAESQESGKGRLGREWYSPGEENLYLSIILKPEIAPVEAPGITLLSAVAAAETLIKKNLNPVIKWPNDILINGKKIAGILTEMNSDPDMVKYIITGIGININTDTSKMPKDLRTPPASIFSESGVKCSRAEITAIFLKKFEELYLRFKLGGFKQILERWKELSQVNGKRVKVELLRGTITGICEDIDSTGALLVRDEEGAINHIISGDVTILGS